MPKARPKGVVDGRRVNIPVLPVRVRAMERAGGYPRDLMDGRPSPEGARAGKSARATPMGDGERPARGAKREMPGCQEKLLVIEPATVPKPTQVEGY